MQYINPINKKKGEYIISFPYPTETETCFFQETSPFSTKGTHCPERHSPNGPNRKGVVPDHNQDIKRRVVALALQGRKSVYVNFGQNPSTLPETNMEPENGVSQKENSFPNHQFSGAMLVSGSVTD